MVVVNQSHSIPCEAARSEKSRGVQLLECVFHILISSHSQNSSRVFPSSARTAGGQTGGGERIL